MVLPCLDSTLRRARSGTASGVVQRRLATVILESCNSERDRVHGTIGEEHGLQGEVYVMAADHSIPQPDDAKSRRRNTCKPGRLPGSLPTRVAKSCSLEPHLSGLQVAHGDLCELDILVDPKRVTSRVLLIGPLDSHSHHGQ